MESKPPENNLLSPESLKVRKMGDRTPNPSVLYNLGVESSSLYQSSKLWSYSISLPGFKMRHWEVDQYIGEIEWIDAFWSSCYLGMRYSKLLWLSKIIKYFSIFIILMHFSASLWNPEPNASFFYTLCKSIEIHFLFSKWDTKKSI